MSTLVMPVQRDQFSGKKTQISLDSRLPKTPGTCNSRSTSAGSATPRQSSAGEESDRSPVLSLAQALGDPFQHADKAPFVIRNTFIDAPVGRPLSLEEFFSERAIHSCPASRPLSFDEVGGPPGLAASRPVSFDEVSAPPGLEITGSPVVDKSFHVANDAEHDPFYVIRNTFIDTIAQRPVSLEGFFQPRKIHSCPTSRPTSMDDMELPPGLESLLESIDEDWPQSPPARATKVGEQQQPAFDDTSPLGRASHAAGVDGSSLVPPPPMTWAPMLTQSAVQPPPPFSPGGCVLQLSLSQMVSEPGVDSLFIPSDGSVGHHLGNCKPCAFFHTKGCGNGTKCQFCHICGPDEKRRRKVEKKQFKRVFRHPGASPNAYQSEL